MIHITIALPLPSDVVANRAFKFSERLAMCENRFCDGTELLAKGELGGAVLPLYLL